MDKKILNQAFISMGYRQMGPINTDNCYGKPIGFGMIIAIIKDNGEAQFRSLFRKYKNNEVTIWSSKNVNFNNSENETLKDKDLYEKYITEIAYAEYEINAGKVIYVGNHSDTFAFVTNNDIVSMFL